QKDGDHVEVLVLAGELLQRLSRDPGPEVRLRRLDVALHRHVEPLGSWQMDVKIDRLQGDTNCDGSHAAGARRRAEPPHGPAQALDRGRQFDPYSLRGGKAGSGVLRVDGFVCRTRTDGAACALSGRVRPQAECGPARGP